MKIIKEGNRQSPRVLVRLDHVARIIVNADHRIVVNSVQIGETTEGERFDLDAGRPVKVTLS